MIWLKADIILRYSSKHTQEENKNNPSMEYKVSGIDLELYCMIKMLTCVYLLSIYLNFWSSVCVLVIVVIAPPCMLTDTPSC